MELISYCKDNKLLATPYQGNNILAYYEYNLMFHSFSNLYSIVDVNIENAKILNSLAEDTIKNSRDVNVFQIIKRWKLNNDDE